MKAVLGQVSSFSAVELHRTLGWYVVGVLGAVGVGGMALSLLRRPTNRLFLIGFWVGMVAVFGQVLLGLYAFSVDERQPGNIHVFYGVVILFTLAFAYLYRAQLARRPAISYALLALFLMGLGIRAIGNIGQSFGG